MLFTKLIREITYSDVVAFCKTNIKENDILEYKSNFTDNLQKTIAAMANTYGGTIIIGINERDGFPEPPFTGIDYTEGLHERVIQIDVSNIFLPVMPEIQICPPIDNKTFVVIRIPESDKAPHYIMRKTMAYFRTGNISSPEDIADVDRLEWLRNRRIKAIEFRDILLSDTICHFDNLMKLNNAGSPSLPTITISISPIYPSKAFIKADDLEDIFLDIITSPRIQSYNPKFYELLPIQYGLAIYLINKDTFDYIEINHFGIMTIKRNFEVTPIKPTLEQIEDQEKVSGKLINLEIIFECLLSFFEFLISFYNKIGYHGYCKLNIGIENILGISLNRFVYSEPILSQGKSITNNYSLPEQLQLISIPEFSNPETRFNLLNSIIKDIIRTFGSEIDPEAERHKYFSEIAFRLARTGR